MLERLVIQNKKSLLLKIILQKGSLLKFCTIIIYKNIKYVKLGQSTWLGFEVSANKNNVTIFS